jgi:hypothetical protein
VHARTGEVQPGQHISKHEESFISSIIIKLENRLEETKKRKTWHEKPYLSLHNLADDIDSVQEALLGNYRSSFSLIKLLLMRKGPLPPSYNR